MEIGAAIFFTDYSITPTEFAAALEERGFDSLWVAEHSHIPVSHRFTHPQAGGPLVGTPTPIRLADIAPGPMGSIFSSAGPGIKWPTEFGPAAKRSAWFALNPGATSG
jgi:hypothetical protein